MSHVLITANQLFDLDHEQVFTLELIQHFVTIGWHVDVYTNYYGGDFQSELEKREYDERFFITDDKNYEFPSQYDLLWSQDSILSPDFIEKAELNDAQLKTVFSHLSSAENVPVNVYMENHFADVVLTTSAAHSNTLIAMGAKPEKILSGYWVPERFCLMQEKNHIRKKLSHVLILMHKIPNQIYALQQCMASYDITSDIVNYIDVTPDMLLNADAVVSSAEGACYALCMGTPAYIHSESGGKGYITASNIKDSCESGFSGRNLSTSIDIATFIYELRAGFLSAQKYATENRLDNINKWSISSTRFPSLTHENESSKNKKLSEIEAQELQLHCKVRRAEVLPVYSLGKWLQQRQPSPTRTILLNSLVSSQGEYGKVFVAIIDVDGDVDAIERTLDSLSQQLYPAENIYVLSPTSLLNGINTVVEWITYTSHWSHAINMHLLLDHPGYMQILYAGDTLVPQALLLLAEYRVCHNNAAVMYSDEDILVNNEPERLVLKPDCNIDMLRSFPYVGRVMAFSPQQAAQAGGLDSDAQDLCLIDLAWKSIEHDGPQALGHLPEVLIHSSLPLSRWLGDDQVIKLSAQVTQTHLQRMGVNAKVNPGRSLGVHSVKYCHDITPLVSIIIPTRDHLPFLRTCVESLMEKTHYPHYELIIVDNNSQDPGACQFLNDLDALKIDQIRILQWIQPFNFSAINNYAVEQARGDVLLFLNNDIEIIEGDWLSTMLNHTLRPEVGIVSSKMTYPDGRIQHAGFIMGLDGSAALVSQGGPGDSGGYMNHLNVVHNVSAVSGACMMIRRDVFAELGGFNEIDFPVYFGDVDLGLKSQQAGFLNIWTPEATLRHHGGATRLLTNRFGVAPKPTNQQIDRLYAQWLPSLANDPVYHPAFKREAPGFEFATEKARLQKPLPGRPLPVVLACHADFYGCGNYRIIQPYQALEQHALIEGGLHHGPVFNITDVEYLKPDIMVLQGIIGTKLPSLLQRYRQYNHSTLILEYDDYLPNLPATNPARQRIPQDVIKPMRRAIEQADWLVVSTPALAREYERFHSDVRVALNRLSPQLWNGLVSNRRTGKKPRVGWAGGASHSGDLAIIRSVVKELENEVEWVFMGMKPTGAVCEYHSGVPIEYYPEKLASLNLDLSVVPLEINQFNVCKSNLRLLELGACGVPIICTDIEPYRCDLPVTRVDNRFKSWVEAIRMHINEMESTARIGNTLKHAIESHWMLDGENLEQWRAAWLPK